jgi:sulfite oxidase
MGLWGKREDMVVHRRNPYNAESPPGVLLEQFRTDVDRFYSRNHGPVPDIEPADWSLTLDGLVDTPQVFELGGLQRRFQLVTVTATLQCAGNRRADLSELAAIPGEQWGPCAISTAAWTGVRLADVLATAGVRPAAAHVEFSAPDQSAEVQPPETYGSSIPLAKAAAPDVLVAWAMNGEPLPRLHGGPVRIVVPGYIGARSVKWVDRITVRADESENYYQQVAYRLRPADTHPDSSPRGSGIALGLLPVTSAVLVPSDRAEVAAGPLTVSGYAFSGGGREIARVEVSVDGGTGWTQAELYDRAGPWAWTLWRASVDVRTGPVEVVARAWDESASTQPETSAQVWNDKGYLNNAWARVRLTVLPAATTG